MNLRQIKKDLEAFRRENTRRAPFFLDNGHRTTGGLYCLMNVRTKELYKTERGIVAWPGWEEAYCSGVNTNNEYLHVDFIQYRNEYLNLKIGKLIKYRLLAGAR